MCLISRSWTQLDSWAGVFDIVSDVCVSSNSRAELSYPKTGFTLFSLSPTKSNAVIFAVPCMPSSSAARWTSSTQKLPNPNFGTSWCGWRPGPTRPSLGRTPARNRKRWQTCLLSANNQCSSVSGAVNSVSASQQTTRVKHEPCATRSPHFNCDEDSMRFCVVRPPESL